MNKRTLGIIIVDHGSRRHQSNEMLLQVVEMFVRQTDYSIVEPAHMELVEPSIQTAFDRCAARGAELIVVHPYFLSAGRHWDQDIPTLSAAAAQRHPQVSFLVTSPLGPHPLMAEIIHQRIEHCLGHIRGEVPPCEVCEESGGCRVETPRPASKEE